MGLPLRAGGIGGWQSVGWAIFSSVPQILAAIPAYLAVILLSRVISRLGDLEHLNPRLIEGLFAGDLAYLQDLYRRVNDHGHDRLAVSCPHCEQEFEVEMPSPGE